MKNNFLKSKGSRQRVFAVISVAIIIILFALNLVLKYFGTEKSIFIDTTPQGLYTLSDMMKEECAFVNEDLDDGKKVKITFCADPDTLIKSQITRAIYFMALQMENTFDNIEVETVNVTYNPTAVSEYKPTSLSSIAPSDIIVSYGDRYRIAGANSFWTTSGGELYAYNGEYKMASIIMSVTAKDRPVAYFVTNHGETYYDPDNPESEGSINSAYLYDLLTERGLEVRTLDLSAETRIPEDCVLLIINNPKTDFTVDEDRLDEYSYVSETEMLDRYLVSDYGSIMVTKDYANEGLTNLSRFLYDWGIVTSSSLVKDEGSYLDTGSGDASTLVGIYDSDEEGYAQAIYGEFATLSSAPSMIFKNSGYVKPTYDTGTSIPEDGADAVTRSYAPFFFTSDKAKAYAKDEYGDYVLLESADTALHTAAVTTRLELNTYTAEYKYSYLFCANSAEFFSNDLLGNASYANYDVMSALVENMIRSDEYANIDLGSESANSSLYGGKAFLDTSILTTNTEAYDSTVGDYVVIYKGITDGAVIWLTVLVCLAPVCVLAIGIAVSVKRRFL